MGAAGQARLPQLELGGVYLSETEIDELNRIVVMFLDFAEDQARRRAQIFLKDWQARLDDFLRFNDRAVLPDAGRVSREEANRVASEEYSRFAARRRAELEAEGEAELRAIARTQRPTPKRHRGPPPRSAPPHPQTPTFFATPSCTPSPPKPYSPCALPRTRRPQAPVALSTPKTREPPGATNTEGLDRNDDDEPSRPITRYMCRASPS